MGYCGKWLQIRRCGRGLEFQWPLRGFGMGPRGGNHGALRDLAYVAAGVPPTVEGGVSPSAIPHRSREVSWLISNMKFSFNHARRGSVLPAETPSGNQGKRGDRDQRGPASIGHGGRWWNNAQGRREIDGFTAVGIGVSEVESTRLLGTQEKRQTARLAGLQCETPCQGHRDIIGTGLPDGVVQRAAQDMNEDIAGTRRETGFVDFPGQPGRSGPMNRAQFVEERVETLRKFVVDVDATLVRPRSAERHHNGAEPGDWIETPAARNIRYDYPISKNPQFEKGYVDSLGRKRPGDQGNQDGEAIGTARDCFHPIGPKRLP